MIAVLWVRALVATVLSVALIGVVLFGPAGTLAWPAGWVFVLGVLVYSVVQVAVMVRSSPGLLRQRLRPTNGTPWGYLFFVAWAVLMALDAVRLHWSHMPLALQVIGGLLLVASFPLIILTFRENAYAVPEVRVQAEQRVIASGPYRYVRHPLYGCAVLFLYGTPLLLGSWYGLAFATATVAYLASRAIREERLLRRELPGYAEYMVQVRYRLIPYSGR